MDARLLLFPATGEQLTDDGKLSLADRLRLIAQHMDAGTLGDIRTVVLFTHVRITADEYKTFAVHLGDGSSSDAYVIADRGKAGLVG